MMAINKQVQISVDTTMDRPQARRVTFTTAKQNIFYLELAMDKTEFIKLHDFDISEAVDPDDIIENEAKQKAEKQKHHHKQTMQMMILWQNLVCNPTT